MAPFRIASHKISNNRKVELTSTVRGSYKIIEETGLTISILLFTDLLKASEKYDEIIEGRTETDRQEASYLQETTITYPKNVTPKTDRAP